MCFEWEGGGMKTATGVQPHEEKSVKSSGTKVPPPVSPPKEHNNTPNSYFQHLPHIDLAGHYQFVTFRTYDSLDEFIRKWDFSPAISNKEKQQKIDDYLDASPNGAYLQGEVLEWLFEFLVSQDKKLYKLVAFAIMNNHVHILFKPLQSLSKIMQRIKGVSAKKINELLGKSGRFWADDYYDKAIRDERHFWVVYEYIKNNPLKIGGIGSEALASHKSWTKVSFPKSSMVKVPLPRFYGVYE